MSNVIDGKQVAADTRASVAAAVSTLGFTPTLAVVLVGDDPASQVYVRNKIKFTEETGMRSVEHRLSAESTETEVVEIVRALNADTDVDGILVHANVLRTKLHSHDCSFPHRTPACCLPQCGYSCRGCRATSDGTR